MRPGRGAGFQQRRYKDFEILEFSVSLACKRGDWFIEEPSRGCKGSYAGRNLAGLVIVATRGSASNVVASFFF